MPNVMSSPYFLCTSGESPKCPLGTCADAFCQLPCIEKGAVQVGVQSAFDNNVYSTALSLSP